MEIDLKEYINEEGESPFERWFNKLNAIAAAKVTTALTRLSQGNTSNTKSLGGGVHEYKIHFGSGYRIYFGKEGEAIVILLCGGTKKKQSQDIEKAKSYWKDYKARKKILT